MLQFPPSAPLSIFHHTYSLGECTYISEYNTSSLGSLASIGTFCSMPIGRTPEHLPIPKQIISIWLTL